MNQRPRTRIDDDEPLEPLEVLDDPLEDVDGVDELDKDGVDELDVDNSTAKVLLEEDDGDRLLVDALGELEEDDSARELEDDDADLLELLEDSPREELELEVESDCEEAEDAVLDEEDSARDELEDELSLDSDCELAVDKLLTLRELEDDDDDDNSSTAVTAPHSLRLGGRISPPSIGSERSARREISAGEMTRDQTIASAIVTAP